MLPSSSWAQGQVTYLSQNGQKTYPTLTSPTKKLKRKIQKNFFNATRRLS